jgi:hypothetical protein
MLSPDEVQRRQDAWMAYDAEHDPDSEVRRGLREDIERGAALERGTVVLRAENVTLAGPGFYRAPAVARGLAGVLVAYRRRHNLTQRQLARQLLIHQSQLARLEKPDVRQGRDRTPDVETLARVARELGLTLTIRLAPDGPAGDALTAKGLDDRDG